MKRLGMLVSGSAATNKSRMDAFLNGLRDLGYIEGKTIAIDYRFAEGRADRFANLADEMVRLHPDVIVVGSNAFTAAAKEATRTIPIVSNGGDLVGQGLVASLARPGGNVTGITNISTDLAGKRLELLEEAIGGAPRVAVLWRSGPSDAEDVKQIERAARSMKIKIQSLQIGDPKDFRGAFATMKKEHANAVTILQGSFTLFHRKELLQLAGMNRLASMCEQAQWTEDGCLISYGPDPLDIYRRLASYVDKILKGAKPADLPVEQPRKFELTVNLKTAKQIGLTIPPNVLARADKVIR
jgi:putative tryptophan/tyrosine transport system substrate-binding protein